MSQARILIVEDENIVALDLKTNLNRLGYAVVGVASSGEEAISKATELEPDLVLMDIKLKGPMDGIITADQIRTQLDLPVIYLTAYADEVTLQRAKITNPLGYLLKPFQERDLQITLEMALYRHKLERKLKESQRLLSITLTSIGDGVITTDGQGCITFMNPVAQALTGWEQADALGRELTEVFHIVSEETQTLLESPVAAALREGSSINLVNQTLLLNKQGQGITIEDNAAPIRDEQGNINGVVLVFRDITQRKQGEAALQKAKEAAETASRAKSEFLANMSHEIRTPLNGVLGMTELLLDMPLTAEQRDYVETIHSCGDTLLTLISDILNFSKLEADKLELEQQPFNLRDCIEAALDLLAPRAAEKGLELTYLLQDQLPEMLVGDTARLRQILVNLLSNAVKFTQVGEVGVRVTAHSVPEECGDGLLSPRCQVHFAVSDTGIGIPQDRQNRLFQAFSQVDTSMTRRYGGIGLGLAISKRLSELMGGAIWLESDGAPDQGSTFHFTIVTETVPGQKRVYPNTSQSQLAGKRLLIVDDNTTNRYNLSLQTQSWGMLPHDTPSASEALQWIRRGDPFDAALVDIQMPEMDGITLAAQIRQIHDAAALPLVLLTTLGQEQETLQSPECNGAAILTKPVKYSQLQNALAGIFTEPAHQTKPDGYQTARPPLALHHPLRILLAEDDLVNQKVATLFLQTMGYQPDVAINGREVLELLARQPYDVILMDIQMPEMDGLEATTRIYQGWSQEQQPRIIALTANAIEGDRDRYLAAGMDDYLCKPIKIQELMQALERCQSLSPSIV